MNVQNHSIWVFGDYRNYFQNRVTLQLIAKANELASKTGGDVSAIVLGHSTNEYVKEYIAHGAHNVYVIDSSVLSTYSVDRYAALMTTLARTYEPETILIGATSFGRELAPKIAKNLSAGLTADCVGLDINKDNLLVQTAPAFGGNMLAEIVTPVCRPQMATVRPGVFQERPHDYERIGNIIPVPLPRDLPKERVRCIRSQQQPLRTGKNLEKAKIVVCGGRGMSTKSKFKKLLELARILDGEVGATRPVVYANWIDHEALIGQAGKHIKPQILFSFGISGAIQHTAAITSSEFIIAVNKNPNAMMMKMADVAIVADTSQICATLIKELKKRIKTRL